jgi:sortase A
MKSQIPLNLSLSIIGIAGIIFSIVCVAVSFPSLQAEGSVIASGVKEEERVPPETFMHLRIPSINLDVPVESVGVTPEGAMDVPAGPANAAWFNLGPRPGSKGSAIIDGHFGSKDGIPAVFDDLNKLQKGDKIYVLDSKGISTTFVVRELKVYSKDDDTSKVFGSSDGEAHLNLITCAGAWDNIKKTHSDRLVVFTDKL